VTVTTTDQVPIAMITGLLLPADLRTELCITGITTDGDQQLLRFRIDPGNAYQRRGYVRNIEGAQFNIGVAERYLPDGPRRYLCGSDGIPAGDVPDQLRAASGWAYTWDADRDHWLDARPRHTPAWSGRRRDITSAAEAAAQRARAEHLTHYLYPRAGRFVYATNPPAEGAFFSVTLRGDWSAHHGRETYPLETAPDDTASATRNTASPVKLAQADQAAGESVVLPFFRREETVKPQATSRGRRR